MSSSEPQNSNNTAGLRLLASKHTPIDKYQYLTHLRATNVHLFYRLLSENVKVWGSTAHLGEE